MLSPRRAIVAAAFILTVLFLLSRSHNAETPIRTAKPAPAAQDSKTNAAPPNRPAPAAAGRPAAEAGAAASNKSPSGQKPMMDISKLPLREQLAHQYPYVLESKFPAYIWQTWKTTPADESFEFREQEASWTELHPGFVHEVITDDVATALLRLLYAGVPDVVEAYRALPLPVLRADFFRYLILYARGGIYTDIDTSAIRSAIEWVPDSVPRNSVGLVIGIEADPDREDWAKWYSRRIQFCQWTIQAKPGHPALRETISRITEETLRRKRSGELNDTATLDRNVIEFTGPAVWTDTVFKYLNDGRFFNLESGPAGTVDWRNFTGMEEPKKVGDVLVLPITGFSPGVRQMGAKEYDDPQAMVKHDFEGTWKPENERHIGEIVETVVTEKPKKEKPKA
ncbi:related to mannosyltransferase [Cephalotrichum gorgonifer]|uniref:Related to mannosyltransferase n=1 Tax=Cephalotrichum gorgonifer TaxID=2041049 RepID=A0AAE8MVI0_9PEZI|nr:related to mannosyltransferase [Cephalotrichum gorgonifer]